MRVIRKAIERRPRRRRCYAKSAKFPRWMAATEVVLIGLVLWLAASSDAYGRVAKPGLGSALYLAVVIAVAALVLRTGRNRPE